MKKVRLFLKLFIVVVLSPNANASTDLYYNLNETLAEELDIRLAIKIEPTGERYYNVFVKSNPYISQVQQTLVLNMIGLDLFQDGELAVVVDRLDLLAGCDESEIFSIFSFHGNRIFDAKLKFGFGKHDALFPTKVFVANIDSPFIKRISWEKCKND